MIVDGNIKLLGDTHLGRRFFNNVPLHRRGDREKMIWEQFEKELNPEGCKTHIHMGDIFDKPVVDFNTLWKAVTCYKEASSLYPNTQFYIIRGNHDATRDLEAVTAFDLFTELTADCDNIYCVDEWTDFTQDGKRYALFGWGPVDSAESVAEDFASEGRLEKDITVFGHWDVDLRSNPFNLIPTSVFSRCGVTRAYTGHVHKPTKFDRDDIEVTVVGSMQPYAFGEQANDDLYVEVTLEELTEDPEAFKNKCVRVNLQPGEVYDLTLDCLQLQLVPASTDPGVGALDVKVDEFDVSKLYEETLADFEIPEHIKEQVKSKWLKISS